MKVIIFFTSIFLVSTLAIARIDIHFKDHFTDNHQGWILEDNDVRMTQISAGKLRFEHKRSTGGAYSWQNIPIDAAADFTIESSLKHVAGPLNQGYGLVWGMSSVENYFAFEIANTGFYRIAKMVDGNWQEISGWKQSIHINQYFSNILSVEKIGKVLKFHINGVMVEQTDFLPFFGDALGFVIWLDQTIEIDYIRVSDLRPASTEHLIPQFKRAFAAVLQTADDHFAAIVNPADRFTIGHFKYENIIVDFPEDTHAGYDDYYDFLQDSFTYQITVYYSTEGDPDALFGDQQKAAGIY